MKTLQAPTEEFIKGARTNLAADAQAGSSVILTVGNGEGYAADDFIVLGQEGSEGAEMCQITNVTNDTITVDVLKRGHLSDEPIVLYKYDQRKFYGSPTATGTFTELAAGSPADISVDDPQGTECEYTGAEGYLFFKATYYNSATSDETDIDDSTAVQGDDSGRYCYLFEIRKQSGLTNNPFITEDVVERKRTEAENEVNSYLYRRYTLPLAEVPALIRNCTILLAAGYLDYQEFGGDGEGVKWLGEARAILKKLQDGKQRLIGSDFAEMALKSGTSGILSYPDSEDNEVGPTRHFSIDDDF